MAISFFTTIDDYRQYVRGVDASTKIDELAPDFNSAKPYVFNILEQTLWDLLLAYYASPTPVDAKKAILLGYIQIALANFTQMERFPTQAAMDTAKDYYKYQIDAIMAKYRTNGYNALNDIINYLDAEKVTFTAWEATQTYIERAALIISNYKEFDSIYSIDGSAYFFVRTIFLQKETINDQILPRIGSINAYAADEGDIESITAIKTALKISVNRALVYYTMYLAIRRFDVINLPVSIRNAVTNEQTKVIRTGYNDAADMASLSADLLSKAQKYFRDIENGISKLNETEDITEIEPNLNEDDNKFYLTT